MTMRSNSMRVQLKYLLNLLHSRRASLGQVRVRWRFTLNMHLWMARRHKLFCGRVTYLIEKVNGTIISMVSM